MLFHYQNCDHPSKQATDHQEAHVSIPTPPACIIAAFLPSAFGLRTLSMYVAWPCRESLQEIEARLLAAEEAARQAKDAVQGQADIAKLERERALAARAEAEQANKNLDSARSHTCCLADLTQPCACNFCGL